jgi:hypothetical protein
VKLDKNAPWMPCKWEPADAAAIQALVRGDATEDQQKRAINWIITVAAGYYEEHFRPDARETDYYLGRAYVGRQIVKLGKIGLSKLRELEAQYGRSSGS